MIKIACVYKFQNNILLQITLFEIGVFEEEKRIVQRKLSIFYGTLLPDKANNSASVCDENCNNYWNCLSMKRVIFIMKLYNKMKHRNCKQTVEPNSDFESESESDDDDDDDDDDEEYNHNDISNDIIERLMLCEGYSLTQFVDDFNQIKINHLEKNVDSWKCIKQKLGSCKYIDDDNCFMVQRHLRERHKYDNNTKQRKSLYGNNCDSKQVVPIQILDQVHHFIMHYKKHLFPIYKHQNDNDDKKDNTIIKSNNVKQIRQRQNRFVTDTGTVNDMGYVESFEFGQLFHHWRFYKDRQSYIKPQQYRHENLKKEMLNNKLCQLGVYEWDDTLTKAITYKFGTQGRRLIAHDRGDYNRNRDVPRSLSISIAHLMVILIYTNYDNYQREFKKKGMRVKTSNNNCSMKNLVNDHCEIAHFYKLFTETVLFYGSKMNESKVLYHGINTDQLFFTQFHPKFNAPISTTDTVEIAKSFCGLNNNGMILELRADKCRFDEYFYCWCSDHNYEKEHLFAKAHYLFINDIKLNKDIINLNCLSFSKYIVSMSLLQDILMGIYFTYSIPDYAYYESILIELFETITDNHQIIDNQVIPQYIVKSFGFFYREYKKKKLKKLYSDYIKLKYNTRQIIERHFVFEEKENVKEFKWSFINDDKMRAKSIVQSDIYSFDDNKDIFSFYLYIKPKTNISGSKISVGIIIKDISLTPKEINIEWGFKCDETKYCSSKLTEVLKVNRADAYKAFPSSELSKKSIKSLTFTYYIKLL